MLWQHVCAEGCHGRFHRSWIWNLSPIGALQAGHQVWAEGIACPKEGMGMIKALCVFEEQ